MRKIDQLYLMIQKMRDRRVESLWDHLSSTSFKTFSFDMVRALFGLLLLAGLVSVCLIYFYHIRSDVMFFFSGQVYLVVCTFLLLLPFWVQLLHKNEAKRKHAVLMLQHRKSKLLRFLLFFLMAYAVIGISLCIVTFLLDNRSSDMGWHLPSLLTFLHTFYGQGVERFYAFWLVSALSMSLFVEGCYFILLRNHKFQYRNTARPEQHPFGLWLGKSTGLLSKLSHGSGMAKGKSVSLKWQDAAQNILIFGGTGSGKTTQLIHPLLAQLLDQKCGGLIFDIKGNFANAVTALAKATGNSHRLFLIGPEHLSINLLEGLTPEVAASFLKSSFLLSGSGGADVNRFFTDTASELCRTALGVLSFIPDGYHLQSLYRYLFEETYQNQIHQQADTLLSSSKLNPHDQHLLKAYRQYRQQTFEQFDDKLKGNVLASVAQILSPFNHPQLIQAFCQSSECQLNEVLEGAIFLVQLPLAKWGLGGRVADNLIKLRFFNVMQQRELHPDWNQDRLVFFMCDEYQEIISANKEGLSDLNFWDKSRSSKTLGIISAQSIKSFYAAIGDRDCADAILQNFRQKLSFRTEDQETLNYLNYLTGRVEVEKLTESEQSGSSSSSSKGGSGRHRSRTQTWTTVEKPVLDPQLIRNLKPNQAVALLTIDGYSRDDVIDTEAIYL